MPALQQHLVQKGALFTNFYATIAVCCPSRVSLMRGQAAHNTNNTNVSPPAGGYPKFVVTGEDDDYLPHWLTRAGYQAECKCKLYCNADASKGSYYGCLDVGKLFNGNSLLTYSLAPKGWNHSDVLVSTSP